MTRRPPARRLVLSAAQEFLVVPDAGLVAISTTFSPSALIAETGFGATPTDEALAVGLFL
jgi:hypothetical protein